MPGDRAAIAQNIHNIADTERILYNFDEAERLFKQVLEIKREIFGEEHIEIANVYGRLGDTYRQMLRLDEAQAQIEAALAITDRLGLQDDSTTIDLRGNLALVMDDRGLTKDAIVVQSEAVDASRRVDGDRHPNTIIRITNLSLIQNKVGDYENALANSSEAFAYAEKEWATDTRIRAWIGYNRAFILRRLGRLSDAEALHKQAIEHQFRHSGEESERYLNTLGRLGLHYIEVADYNAALETLNRVQAIA